MADKQRGYPGGWGGAGMTQYADVFLGDNWMSPQLPLVPRQGEGEAVPRRFQIQPGYNIAIRPRASEPVDFDMLRAMADYTLARAVIEHLKKAIIQHDWDIAPVDEDSDKSHDADVKVCCDFLEYPDRDQAWDMWVNQLLEERLSIDAATIYRHRTRSGKLWALEIITGQTIKPLVDERGFTPGRGDPSVPAYQQFLYGVPDGNYTRNDLIYAVANRRANRFYGFSEVEQSLLTINQGLRRDLYNLSSFVDSNIPAGLASVPKEWRLEDIKKYQEWFDQRLAGNLQERSKLTWAPEGAKIEKYHDPFELHNTFDEWVARIVCYFFGVSPIPFIKMTNRSVAEEMGDSETEGGVANLKQWLGRLLTEIVQHDLGFPHLKFVWTTDKARLKAKAIEADAKLVSLGVKQIDEVRVERGYKPLNLRPGYPTPTGYMPFAANPLDNPPPEPTVAPQIAPEAQTEDQDGHHKPAGHAGQKPKPSKPAKPQTDQKAQKAVDFMRLEELGQWERYAIARFPKAKHVESFSCSFVDEAEASEIREGLSKAASIEEIKHLFRTRGKNPPPLRIPPPDDTDGARHEGELRAALRTTLVAHAERVLREKGEKEASVSVPSITIKPDIHVNIPEQKPANVTVNPIIEVPQGPRPEVKVDFIAPPPPPSFMPAPVVKVEPRIEVSQPAPVVVPAPVVKIEAPAAPVSKGSKRKRWRIVRDSDNNMVGVEEID